ncbi:MAG: SUMF1/EgtB/PvdO family nonheme iron enzyme, partial [Planctomycetales bacterium]
SFNVFYHGVEESEAVKFSFKGIPQGVEFNLQPLEKRTGRKIEVTVDLETPPASHKVLVLAKSAEQSVRAETTLRIQPPLIKTPSESFEPTSDANIVKAGDSLYHSRIERVIGDGLRVEFILIPKTNSDDPPTFYMMKDKAWNDLFAAFVESGTKPDVDPQWEQGARVTGMDLLAKDHPRNPVFRVMVEDAHACAAWLGGNLPTRQQWDKAAGLFDDDERFPLGPFKGTWDLETDADRAGERFGVDRRADGPLEIGKATDSLSQYGCRDMAGNGYEWTRDILLSTQAVPLANPTGLTSVYLRGQKYTNDQPLLNEDLHNFRANEIPPPARLYNEPDPYTGFRAVVEFSP